MITIAIWSLAFLFATPQAFHEAIKKPSGKQCLLANNLIPYVDEFQFVVFYLIPMVITICTYGQVSYVLWSSSLHLQEGRQRSKDSENDRTRKSVVKMLIACVTVYFSCYTPINLLFLASKLTTKRLEVPKAVRLLLNLLAYACSCVNPFVYSIFSRKFRLRFRQLLTCRKISSLPIEPSAMFSQSACVAQRRLTAIDTAQNRLVYLPLRRESGQDKCSAIRRNVTVNSTNRTQLVTIKDELQEFAELKCQSRD